MTPDVGICLFGGAFDPPHRSHRRLAESVQEALGVDLAVLPAGDHPHKGSSALTPAHHRVEMCRRNFAGLARVHVDDRETRRDGRCYSIDTVREFRRELGPEGAVFWLIGSDNLPLLPTWYDHHALLAEATIVTFPRAGYPIEPGVLAGLDLTERERQNLLAQVLDFPADDRSATRIRDGIAEADDDLTADVAAYIREHGLYR